MKTPSTDLFDLIHCLTSQERAYFKRFATIHKQASDNTYLKLFNAILKQKTYDEQALKKQFENEKLSRYFPRAKKYLEDKIFDAMSLFHAESSMSIKLKREINSTRFLYSKQLFKMALKKVQQIKKDAAEWEYWAEYIAALEIESTIFSKQAYRGIDYKDFVDNRNKSISALKLYGEVIHQYFNQKEMVYLLTQQNSYNEKRTEKLFQKLIGETDDLQGISAQVTRLSCLGLYYQNHLKEAGNAIRYFDEAVLLLEEHPTILNKGMDFYLFFISRLLGLSTLQSSYDTTQTYLQKIEDNLLENPYLKEREDGFKFAVKVEYHYNRLFCLFRFGKHEQTLAALMEADKELKGKIIDLHVAHTLKYHYISMLIYFFHGKFDRAMEEISEALNLEIDQHPTKELMRLWLLFIHWELGNYDLLEHLIRNTVRYWRKHSFYGEYKQFWVGQLRQLLKLTDRKVVWTEICDYFAEQSRQKQDTRLDIWYTYAFSKLEKKPLKEIHSQLIEEKTEATLSRMGNIKY